MILYYLLTVLIKNKNKILQYIFSIKIMIKLCQSKSFFQTVNNILTHKVTFNIGKN